MNKEEIELELDKLREEAALREEKIRSKLSYLLSKIQRLEDVNIGDVFERETKESENNN